MEEAGVMIILFAHLFLLALVARQYVIAAPSKDERIAVVRKSIVFWLVSLGVVILGWAVALFAMTAIYIRSTTPPRESLIWAVEYGVAALLALGSAWLMRERFKKLA